MGWKSGAPVRLMHEMAADCDDGSCLAAGVVELSPVHGGHSVGGLRRRTRCYLGILVQLQGDGAWGTPFEVERRPL